jgi:hypothetical protein
MPSPWLAMRLTCAYLKTSPQVEVLRVPVAFCLGAGGGWLAKDVTCASWMYESAMPLRTFLALLRMALERGCRCCCCWLF